MKLNISSKLGEYLHLGGVMLYICKYQNDGVVNKKAL